MPEQQPSTRSSIPLPRIIFGSSALGNLYQVLDDDTRRSIVRQWLTQLAPPVVIDSAGKYGAGLALENIGRFLKELNIPSANVMISNKLGWRRVPLTAPEPTFEPGVWKGLQHDAVQCISYDGILECWQQGNQLLGDYPAQLVSVHDPDEYLNSAAGEEQLAARYQDILGAYHALHELRACGKVRAVGIGSKDWKIIRQLYRDGVQFDWVMFANSMTIINHPKAVFDFMQELHSAGITLINSAVFQGGFLTGSNFYDYTEVSRSSHPELFAWRDAFEATCREFGIKPALVCCQFALRAPGVAALALNSSQPDRIHKNVALVETPVPETFWQALKNKSLIQPWFP